MPKELSLPEFFSRLSLTDKILVSLLTAGAVASDALEALYEFSPRPILRSLQTPADFRHLNKEKKIIQNALNRLEEKKIIEIEKKERERILKLTETGLTNLFLKFPELKFRHWSWDGDWRVIIYDVEEEVRRLRDRLRTTLRSLGFNPVQRSVWFSPYPVEEKLEEFLRKEKLWDKIMIFKTELKLVDSEKLLKSFYPNLIVDHSLVGKG